MRRLLWVVPAMALAAGCGKKGPPLAPIVRIPAAIDQIAAQRTGRHVFVTLTVPSKNVDSSVPVDISRIEVYAYTGRVPPPRARWVEFGTLVGSVPVAPPVPEGGEEAPPERSGAEQGALPGSMVTILDSLSPDELAQGRVAPPAPPRGGQLATAPVATDESGELRRFYVAYGFSARGRPGPPGTAADFPLADLPEAPAFVSAPYDATSVALEWTPSGGIVGFLFDRPLSAEDVPLDDQFEPIARTAPVAAAGGTPPPDNIPSAPLGPVRYNVYRDMEPDPIALFPQTVPPSWNVTRPAPLNSEPLETMAFVDPVELDRPRCYVVRALRGTAPNVVEGEASPPACVTPTDIFPPGAPARLVAVADQGGISLVWEPNNEPDLGGYLVLRGEASDATLQPLTPEPVVEPRFRDTRVTPGTRYVYSVVAIDAHLPVSNVSAESNRVEETAR